LAIELANCPKLLEILHCWLGFRKGSIVKIVITILPENTINNSKIKQGVCFELPGILEKNGARFSPLNWH
jgi:hypothetical protein